MTRILSHANPSETPSLPSPAAPAALPMTPASCTPPLAGLRVVDLSTVLSGPIATAILADQGAEVVKVEPPEGDTCRLIGPAKGDLSAMFIAVNRGKRSIALDLKSSAALEVLHALIARADVLVSNFRPGVMERLGLADAPLQTLNPRLVRLVISGYGEDGPRAGDKVYDAVIQAVAGVAVAHADRTSGQPTMLATAVCDKLTALTAAQAVTAALWARERDGQGRRVDVSMLDATLAFQWPDAMYNHMFMDEPPAPFPEFGATQKPWKTLDGFVATMTPQQAEFIGMCEALGRPDIPKDPRFSSLPTRGRHTFELRALLEPLMAQFTTAHLEQAFRERNVPIGRVNQRAEVLQDAQVAHNHSLTEVAHAGAGRVRLARAAARFDGAALPTPKPAPHLGEHGNAVLQELGWSDDQIAGLAASGVLKQPK